MAATLLIHAFEIGVAQKTQAAGKLPHLKSCVRIPFRSDGAHGDLILPDTGAACGNADDVPRHTGLFAETWFHRDPLAPLGATAGKYFLAALGLHARAKSVLLGSLAPVGLECTLGHER